MSLTLRSLFAVSILVAGVTGCAVDNDDAETVANDEQTENADQEKQAEEQSPKVEESKLSITKKGITDRYKK